MSYYISSFLPCSLILISVISKISSVDSMLCSNLSKIPLMKDLVRTWLFLEIGQALCCQAVETELTRMQYKPLVCGAYDTAVAISVLYNAFRVNGIVHAT